MSTSSNNRLKISIVVSQFSESISNSLLEGAKRAFLDAGGKILDLSIFFVPGAYEIPATVRQVLKNIPHLDAIVTLGSIIRGETAHFDYVAGECSRGIMELSLNTDIPILFGVLTTENVQQALKRSGEGVNNKGYEVMNSAIKTIKTFKDIQL